MASFKWKPMRVRCMIPSRFGDRHRRPSGLTSEGCDLRWEGVTRGLRAPWDCRRTADQLEWFQGSMYRHIYAICGVSGYGFTGTLRVTVIGDTWSAEWAVAIVGSSRSEPGSESGLAGGWGRGKHGTAISADQLTPSQPLLAVSQQSGLAVPWVVSGFGTCNLMQFLVLVRSGILLGLLTQQVGKEL